MAHARSGCVANHREPSRTRGAALLRRHSTAAAATAVAAVPAVSMTTFVVTTPAAVAAAVLTATTYTAAYILLRDASRGNRSVRTRFSSAGGRRTRKIKRRNDRRRGAVGWLGYGL